MNSSHNETFVVVINIEDQYSIWPKKKDIPYGWEAIDKFGSKDECLSYIKEVWKDLRPKSLKDSTANIKTQNITSLENQGRTRVVR